MTIPTPRKRDRTKRGTWWTLKRRRYLYGIAAAAAPVAVSYGLVSGDQTVSLLFLAAAVLGLSGTALANPTTE